MLVCVCEYTYSCTCMIPLHAMWKLTIHSLWKKFTQVSSQRSPRLPFILAHQPYNAVRKCCPALLPPHAHQAPPPPPPPSPRESHCVGADVGGIFDPGWYPPFRVGGPPLCALEFWCAILVVCFYLFYLLLVLFNYYKLWLATIFLFQVTWIQLCHITMILSCLSRHIIKKPVLVFKCVCKPKKLKGHSWHWLSNNSPAPNPLPFTYQRLHLFVQPVVYVITHSNYYITLVNRLS